jgi:hypothetical protein
VPLALVGTFALMYVAGFSLDNLSLMGLSIAVGFVVDDAIVMLENIQRHVEEGLAPIEAALKEPVKSVSRSCRSAFAGRRVHSAAVDGWNRWPNLSRIRDHSHDDDRGVSTRRADTNSGMAARFLKEKGRPSRASHAARNESSISCSTCIGVALVWP